MLDLNLVFSLAVACAPGVAPETLAAVAYAESRFDPLAIGVNTGPRPARRPRDAAEAAAIARDLLDRGANLDLGLAQINSGNLDWLDLSLEAAFDPCRNLAAAGAVLRDGYRAAPGETVQATLRRALSRYNTGHPRRGFANGYVARVETAARRLGLGQAPRPVAPAILEAEPEPAPPPAWDVFGRARASAVLAFSPPPPDWSPRS